MFIEDVRVDITVTPRIIVCVHPDRYRNTLTRKADYIIPDCIDIQVEVTPVPVTQLSNLQSGEPSSVIRQRVATARAYSRILKVARTIADLEGASQIQQHHIAVAVGYRNLDRGNWGE